MFNNQKIVLIIKFNDLVNLIKQPYFRLNAQNVIGDLKRTTTQINILKSNTTNQNYILGHRLLASHEPRELEFLGNLTIIDSQDNYYESLTSTLFSLNEQVSPDPILRVSRNVDHLFELGYFDLIIGHNDNCLKSTHILLQKRYFKVNLLEYECRYK